MIPNAYYKNIFEIDYKKLKKKGYKNLFFDVDNTLLPYKRKLPDEKTKDFVNDLKKDFNVVIVSNSRSKRVLRIIKEFGVEGYYSSMKPLSITYKKILKKYKREESVFIGDQFMTDVLGAYRNKFQIILVDRLKYYEPITTKFWRLLESFLLKKYSKKGIFSVKGYYDNIK